MNRLVLVGPLPPPLTGQAVAFATVVEECRRLGVPAAVIDLGTGQRSASTLQGVTLRRILAYPIILARFAGQALSSSGTVYLTIAQSRAGFARDLAVVFLATRRQRKLVLHLHGGNYDGFYRSQPPILQRLVRWMLRRADAILVLGEGLRSMFDFDPTLDTRVHIVPNGVPDDRMIAASKTLPAGDDPVHLLFLSNLIESKGYFDVLEAVRLLDQSYGTRPFLCHFCGAFLTHPDDVSVSSVAQARRLFHERVASYRLETVVKYHGTVTGQVKDDILEKAHVMLLPTAYDNEGQPLAILEAMAAGCVVVATPFRAIPDMVDPGRTGLHVPYGEPAALARTIARLLDDPALYAKLSESAVDTVRRKFTRKAHVASLFQHFISEPSNQ